MFFTTASSVSPPLAGSCGFAPNRSDGQEVKVSADIFARGGSTIRYPEKRALT